MNPPEKLAATYLRLNGFFLIPNFTVFGRTQHTDIDLIGLRAPHARERVGDFCFPIDEKLIAAIGGEDDWHAVVAQVKGNDSFAFPSAQDVECSRSLVATAKVTALAFTNSARSLSADEDGVTIGLEYAVRWIWKRFELMDQERLRLTKEGSWTWSEPFLATLLALRRFGMRY